MPRKNQSKYKPRSPHLTIEKRSDGRTVATIRIGLPGPAGEPKVVKRQGVERQVYTSVIEAESIEQAERLVARRIRQGQDQFLSERTAAQVEARIYLDKVPHQKKATKRAQEARQDNKADLKCEIRQWLMDQSTGKFPNLGKAGAALGERFGYCPKGELPDIDRERNAARRARELLKKCGLSIPSRLIAPQ